MIGRRHFGELASRQHAHSVVALLRSRSDHGRRRQMAAGDTTVGSTPRSIRTAADLATCGHSRKAPRAFRIAVFAFRFRVEASAVVCGGEGWSSRSHTRFSQWPSSIGDQSPSTSAPARWPFGRGRETSPGSSRPPADEAGPSPSSRPRRRRSARPCRSRCRAECGRDRRGRDAGRGAARPRWDRPRPAEGESSMPAQRPRTKRRRAGKTTTRPDWISRQGASQR